MDFKNKIVTANHRLNDLLSKTQMALQGERDFGPNEVSALGALLTEMDPIIAQGNELRILEPELGKELDLYKCRLSDLKSALDKIYTMLAARRASLCANHAQMTAVGQWTKALQQTR
jgi:hypothetical protein